MLFNSLTLMCEERGKMNNYFGVLASYSVVKIRSVNYDMPFNQSNFDFKYYGNISKNFKFGMGFNYSIYNGTYTYFDQLGITPLIRYTYKNYVYAELGYQVVQTLTSQRIKTKPEQYPHIAIGCIVPLYRQLNLEFQVKNNQFKTEYFKVNNPTGLLGLNIQF